MDQFSFLNAIHSEYIEELYQKYLSYPDSLEPSWKAFFQGFDFANTSYEGKQIINEEKKQFIVDNHTGISEDVVREFKVINLINEYRMRGHFFTKTNPVRQRRTYTPTLDIENFGLTTEDLSVKFNGKIIGLDQYYTLAEIIQLLNKVYCNSIGIEYMYIQSPIEIRWIQEWLKKGFNQPQLNVEEKKRILKKLSHAVAFENFLHTKFVGQKRFSLEGGETLIPALDEIINSSSELGVEEIVIGMAHRGRLNVLANIFNKSYSQIFTEFEGKDYVENIFSGDVKYHLGSCNKYNTKKGKVVNISLAPNPSHLETVDAVVEGIARAKADHNFNEDYSKVLPILIHGDAAIAAQGIVYEVLQMMKLDGYKTGGTIHIVINNQIGFTTNYLDARSSSYCTDIAKTVRCPVLHVNADDAEAVIHAVRFASEYRSIFHKDVFIDLLGYRKYGHNEGDEPRFTQPKLYKLIAKHPNPREIYKAKLEQEDVITPELIAESEEQYKQLLDKNLEDSRSMDTTKVELFMQQEWKNFDRVGEKELLNPTDTSFPIDELRQIAKVITQVPENKNLFNKIQRLLNQRKEMVEVSNSIDWGMAELLAYGTLLMEGHTVRLSGEDVERGTFSHRHAVIKTEDTEEEIITLNQLNTQAKFYIYNSLLSEYGVLGFEYGYAMTTPYSLTIWEAQFGDFANGAQIVIDQYLSAAEDKWKMQNGLVMLLPHGFEGQGAEHSSARIERFLSLCANGNMYVINSTTPANFYHAIRRQLKPNFRKPLIVFSPKSLLRHPKVTSTLEELAEGSFHEVIDDPSSNVAKVTRLVFCSGKIYYDLLNKKEELMDEKVALVRIEQLYPLHWEKIYHILDKYENKKEFYWVQEEPENMGAWWYILKEFRKFDIDVISPKASSSPSPGSHDRYIKIQKSLINSVFNNIK
ncbi:2-oxoglutarate dehydrogenase E1 component [Apibacter muscae]|uniref:oxoglutarate dehydrogenase (succinyl-transferring) n=1 Tax=Apibacter muscae TaxID=2509004 RepID=A0A563D7W0_9FLAO|nr:2-oxoglutarate dehydrogenase E1 component [Apibacter muscae]TWP26159.1 2-oxoglutarate dehydrogenase E1 component [Apibacter muscae]